MTTAQQSLYSLLFVTIQPPVHGIRVSTFQEPFLRYRVRRLALGDLEDRRTSLSNIRPGIMVPTPPQFLLLCSGQLQSSSLRNNPTPYTTTAITIKPSPPPFPYNETITEVVRQNSLEE
jgi:hypothetical protein